jgi:DeoR/GlpR family transcriptional regulator of sugar metabolism
VPVPTAKKTSKEVPDNLWKKRQNEILRPFESKSILTCADLIEDTGLSRQALRRYLNALESEGILGRWGKGPGTRYWKR